MNRYFYSDSIANFCRASENESLGALAAENSFDLVDIQRNAWVAEISLLKSALAHETV